MNSQRIQLAVFDMAGTTVDDRVGGLPLVLKSYDDALRSQGVVVPMEVLNAQRGRDKWTVIQELAGEKAEAVFQRFLESLRENISSLREVEGSSQVFQFLHEKGVKVVASTGFPREVAQGILDHLGWLEEGLVDGWVCSEDVGASRPNPAMILESMRRHGVSDPRRVLKVDDTEKGVLEGLNAGAYTLAVLTGTQSIQQLSAAGPHAVLRSVAQVPGHLLERKLV